MKSVLALLLILFSRAGGHAQGATVSVDPFPMDAKVLPRVYVGHSPYRVFKALDGIMPEKDEFESHAQFLQRVHNIARKPLYGNISGVSNLAFVIQTDSSYDADQHEMTTTMRADDASDLGLTPEVTYDRLTTPQSVKLETYAASFGNDEPYFSGTSDGNRIMVHKYRDVVYDLLITNPGAWRYRLTESDVESESTVFREKMTSDAARAKKKNLAVLAVFVPAAPFAVHGKTTSEPTLTEPTDRISQYGLIVGKLEELVLYDFVTGEILDRKTPPGIDPNSDDGG